MKGLSAHYIDNWLRFFPQQQLLVIRADALFRTPRRITAKALQWLHLPNHTIRQIQNKECWHNCRNDTKALNTSLANVELSPARLSRLKELYAPSEARLSWHVSNCPLEHAEEV
eukprot:CAMPEP_0174736106 /NCGR_PEP_ID=MMETSP1094-20130205/66070_1 /TAXON_ID=156173 /ORGANISM="Chrysochromulina brevifilum, Strain UTEX LB 985" /LENGTH=113 /DNA_ID=CAMNT_0015939157 /DNA_START=1 /DNA_END=338 /DNA_ORIENTATION=-